MSKSPDKLQVYLRDALDLIYTSLLKIVMFTLLRILEAEQTFPPCSHICKEALWNLLRPSLLLYIW